MKFYKYQGAGNDFIMLDGRGGLPKLSEQRIAQLCNRRFGIGADGLIILDKAEGHDFAMTYFNADGGMSTMCGNGGRCIAQFAHDLGIGGLSKLFFAVDGSHKATMNEDGTISLQMIDIEGFKRLGDDFLLDSGSPHYITFEPYNIEQARAIRAKYDCNVNFVAVTGVGKFAIRTFERGVEDETLACGTGATAAAAMLHFMNQPTIQSFDIEALGGKLNVTFKLDNKILTKVTLTGPAAKVFEGHIEL